MNSRSGDETKGDGQPVRPTETARLRQKRAPCGGMRWRRIMEATFNSSLRLYDEHVKLLGTVRTPTAAQMPLRLWPLSRQPTPAGLDRLWGQRQDRLPTRRRCLLRTRRENGQTRILRRRHQDPRGRLLESTCRCLMLSRPLRQRKAAMTLLRRLLGQRRRVRVGRMIQRENRWHPTWSTYAPCQRS